MNTDHLLYLERYVGYIVHLGRNSYTMQETFFIFCSFHSIHVNFGFLHLFCFSFLLLYETTYIHIDRKKKNACRLVVSFILSDLPFVKHHCDRDIVICVHYFSLTLNIVIIINVVFLVHSTWKTMSVHVRYLVPCHYLLQTLVSKQLVRSLHVKGQCPMGTYVINCL